MLSGDMSALDEEFREGLPSFIESKLMVKTEQEGQVVTFDDKTDRTHVSSPEIKTYLKRYMQNKGIRKRFRLLSQEGTLKFVKLRPDQMEEEEEEDEEQKKEKK
jgi:hypothetical protein